jgi:hypothetical protein
MNKGIPNFKSRSWNRKSKAKTQCVDNVNVKGFYYKNMIRIEQDHEKGMYPKLVLNIFKVMWDFTFIYTYWTCNSRKLFRKLPTYM